MSRRKHQNLADIQANYERLSRPRLLNDRLAGALEYSQPKWARQVLEEWLACASRSKLDSLVRLARMIREHREGILACIKTCLTNGFVEGINNRIRTIAHRAFGSHSAESLISMLLLCASDIELDPPLPTHCNFRRIEKF